MTSPLASGTLCNVIDESENHARPAAHPVEILVSFFAPAGPIAGTIRSGADGAPSDFHGWLELMDAIEAQRAIVPGLSPGEDA